MTWLDFDELARRETRRADRVIGTPPLERGIDTLSRALAVPMSRRRAIGVVSSALLAASVIRPRFASAAPPPCPASGPQSCLSTTVTANGNAAQVCVPGDWRCCSNALCAGACQPWEACVNGGSATAGCNDTPLLCVAEKADGFDARRSQFCSVDLADDGTYCSGGAPRTLKYGWCCFPSQKCGTKLGVCGCSGEVCGEGCCPPDFYCQGGNICLKKCASGAKGVRCGNDCCSGVTRCAGDHCECIPPTVTCGTGCCNPKKTTDDPNVRPPVWDFWRSLIGDTAATHGGATHSLRSLSPAHGAAATAAGAAAAVAQVAAVNAQTGAALAAFTDGHRDSKFKLTVKAAKPSLPKLQAGDGLDAASASALSALLSAQAHASALIAAAATALARQRGATTKHDRAHARRQLLASANFTSQAVKILKGIPKLRTNAATALSAAKTPEIYATSAAVQALQADVRKHGVPADLRAQLARLGVKASADLAHVRKGLLDDVHTVDSIAGGVLVAPLTDSASQTALLTVTTNLATYATKARNHPIARGHG